MAQTNITIRMDDNLKQQFDFLCNELGLSMTTAFNIFAKTMVRQQKIPFEVALDVPTSIPFELRADPFYSADNQSRLLSAKEHMEKNGGTIHELIEVDDD